MLRLRNLLPPGETVTHIVVMGMGESLANLDNLIMALDRLCSAKSGLGLSQRRVTISTVGLPEKIRKLAALDRQYHLAVSLHAPTEELRNELVPVNEKIGLNAVLEAADAYFRATAARSLMSTSCSMASTTGSPMRRPWPTAAGRARRTST